MKHIQFEKHITEMDGHCQTHFHLVRESDKLNKDLAIALVMPTIAAAIIVPFMARGKSDDLNMMREQMEVVIDGRKIERGENMRG